MADEQVLIVDMRLRDNLTGPLAKAKAAVAGVGDAAQAQAVKTSNAFAAAGDRIRASFSGIGADIQKGIGLGLGIGATQLVARGVAELTGFLKDSIAAAAAEEAGIKQLTQSLIANVPAWDQNTAAIEKTIQARQRLGFADDELRSSLSVLTAASHDVGQAFEVQNVAMDLARFKNISLASASDLLVKVQAGSFRALKALGIELDKNATSTEALAAIQGVVSGQAEVFGDTTAGAMARAGIAVQNLQEDIGEGLAPAIKLAADALADFVSEDLPSFAENSEREIRELIKALEFIGSPLGNVADVWRTNNAIVEQGIAGANAATVASTDLTASFVAQERAVLLSAAAAKGLSGELGAVAGAATSATPAEIALAKATIEASEAHVDLAEATRAATEAGSGNVAGLRTLAEAKSADELATAKLKAAQDALLESLIPIRPTMLQAGDSADDFAGSLLRLADNAIAAETALTEAQLAAERAFAVFRQSPNKTGDIGGFGVNFDSGGDQDALSERNRVFQNEQDKIAEEARERERKREEARSKALSAAKSAAADYATTLRDKLDTALRRAKDTATTLFDKLHDRHLQAIADTEKLAAKQHDAASQQINDLLKIKLEQSAAPVTEAEESQRRIESARQRRDLNEGLQSALAGGDPDAIRSAQEALQSFNSAQRINNLRLEQARLDAAAQAEARGKQKAADDQLAAAKLQAAKDIALENDRAKTQRAQFDRELAALKKRDAGASPAKVKADITKLEEKFGITRDAKGFSHIDDLAAAAKNLKPPFKDIGDAAAVATPRLAAVGASATAAADGLAVFTKRLGELKVLELPIPKPIEPPVIREPEMPLDRPRHSVEDMLANAIKNIPIPVNQVFVGPINVYVPPITLNGRIVAAALATSQSPAATPGVRTGTLAPRP